jgi:transcription-repair coupling factor (superfamily II helicase)
MYHKILDEAMHDLQHGEFREVFAADILREEKFVRECQVDTDREIMIPDSYVTSISERLSLYTQLSNIGNEEGLADFANSLRDRFGPLPDSALELFDTIRLQWTAKALGMERVILRNKQMKCYFVANQDSPFYQSAVFSRIMEFVQQHPHACRLKESNRHLILSFEGVSTMQQANAQLLQLRGDAA